VSQGLLVKPEPTHRLGQDVTDELGIKKYEPPTPLWNTSERRVLQKQKGFWGYINAMFPKYTKIKNYKNYNNVIPQSTPVVITEKIHGTNFRAGWVDVSKYKHPWYKRLWSRMTKKLPESVFVIGSHNMIRRKTDPIYHRAAREAGLDKLGEEWSGFVFFGEVYGLGIQELSYGVTPGEIDLVIFDIYYANKYRQVSYLPWGEVQSICVYLGLNTPPVLYEGPWDRSLAKIHADGPSMIPGAKHHREGVVIRPVTETWSPDVGRWILKRISDTYLLGKDRTENH
jgi:RNA ligase (TIGR02306 family)